MGATDTDTDARRDAALAWADAARAVRHRVRRELGAGATTLADVLGARHTDELVGQLRLLWVLESLPGARKTDTRRELARLGLDGDRSLAAQLPEELDAVRAAFPLDPAPVPDAAAGR